MLENAPWLTEETHAFFPLKRAGAEHHTLLHENEGALSLDLHEYGDCFLIRSPIAGVRPADLDLSIHNDMLTIRGRRVRESAEGGIALHQECHWGPFSRSIILPAAVRADEAEASLVDGILTIRLPKATRHGSIPLTR